MPVSDKTVRQTRVIYTELVKQSTQHKRRIVKGERGSGIGHVLAPEIAFCGIYLTHEQAFGALYLPLRGSSTTSLLQISTVFT